MMLPARWTGRSAWRLPGWPGSVREGLRSFHGTCAGNSAAGGISEADAPIGTRQSGNSRRSSSPSSAETSASANPRTTRAGRRTEAARGCR